MYSAMIEDKAPSINVQGSLALQCAKRRGDSRDFSRARRKLCAGTVIHPETGHSNVQGSALTRIQGDKSGENRFTVCRFQLQEWPITGGIARLV